MLRVWQTLLDVRNSLWFIPSVTVLLAIVLAALAIEADTRLEVRLAEWSPRLFGTGSDGARAMLQVIAGAMISTATLTFSITVLVLSNVASQYAPAVIRTFMASRSTQTVLGVFIGIFVYCLVVLRTVRGGADDFIPSISVVIGILLAIIGVGVLVYFVHHVASSIQAPTIISDIAAATEKSLAQHYPDPLGVRPEEEDDPGFNDAAIQWHPILNGTTGHLRSVDLAGLQQWAKERALLLKFETGLGGFVCCGAPLAWSSQPLSKKMHVELHAMHSIGSFRTVEQDPATGLQQLVDIALKAMSPASCDNSTALLCMNYLSSLLVSLSKRKLSVGKEASRVRIPDSDFRAFLRLVITQLRNHAGANPEMHAGMLEMLSTVARLTGSPERRRQVFDEIELLAKFSRQQLNLPGQLELMESDIAAVQVNAMTR